MTEKIEIGFQTYVSDGGEEFGAVRAIADRKGEFVIYVENAGDFTISFGAVESVHSGKVILNCAKLDLRLRRAIVVERASLARPTLSGWRIERGLRRTGCPRLVGPHPACPPLP